MLDWRFNDYEALPLAVILLLDKSTSKNEDALDHLYTSDMKELSEKLWNDTENKEFLEEILEAISRASIITDKKHPTKKLNRENFSSIYVEPVSFFRWAEDQGCDVVYNVRYNVNRRDDELRIKNYKNFTITPDEVKSLMREPLWITYHAIMYLHGFRPADKRKSHDIIQDINAEIIRSDEHMAKIGVYLHDAHKLHDIIIYDSKLHDIRIYDSDHKKVKPLEFMNWAKSLDIDFPNLITADEPNNHKKKQDEALNTRERDTYQNIIGSLLGLLLGKSSNGKPYSQFNSQQSIIDGIHGNYGETKGLSKRNLETKFAEAKKTLKSNFPDSE